MTKASQQSRMDMRAALMKAGELGREEGRLAGILETIVRQATRRFGPVPEETREALAELKEERLLFVAEGLFDLEGLDALARQAWIWNPGRMMLAEFLEASLPLDEAQQANFEAMMEEGDPEIKEMRQAYLRYWQERDGLKGAEPEA